MNLFYWLNFIMVLSCYGRSKIHTYIYIYIYICIYTYINIIEIVYHNPCLHLFILHNSFDNQGRYLLTYCLLVKLSSYYTFRKFIRLRLQLTY